MIVYTCQTPGYDEPRIGGGVVVLPPSDIFRSGRLNAKLPKILPHLFFKSEITVWCDANIYLSENNLKDIREKLETADVVTLTHPDRTCIYEEAQVCIEAGLDEADRIREQCKYYRQKGWPVSAGLYGCGVVARRTTPPVIDACEKWWAHVTRWSSRDQISFPFVFWRSHLETETIPFESVEIKRHLIYD